MRMKKMTINDPTDFEIWFIENIEEIQDAFCKIHRTTLRKYAERKWQELQMED